MVVLGAWLNCALGSWRSLEWRSDYMTFFWIVWNRACYLDLHFTNLYSPLLDCFIHWLALLFISFRVWALLDSPLSLDLGSATSSCDASSPNTSVTMFEGDYSSGMQECASSAIIGGEPMTSKSMGWEVTFFSAKTCKEIKASDLEVNSRRFWVSNESMQTYIDKQSSKYNFPITDIAKARSLTFFSASLTEAYSFPLLIGFS